VYAIYYYGDFTPYSCLVKKPSPPPIYVGKAVPVGSRKGGQPESSGHELCQRLAQHAKSIEWAKNLEIDEFKCRYLVVVPVWIALAERFLVEHYRPIWNVVIDGFGNHDPGAGRRAMKRPRWDVLHPGRPWATTLRADEPREQILERLRIFLEQQV
jgi:hypothetical protein